MGRIFSQGKQVPTRPQTTWESLPQRWTAYRPMRNSRQILLHGGKILQLQ